MLWRVCTAEERDCRSVQFSTQRRAENQTLGQEYNHFVLYFVALFVSFSKGCHKKAAIQTHGLARMSWELFSTSDKFFNIVMADLRWHSLRCCRKVGAMEIPFLECLKGCYLPILIRNACLWHIGNWGRITPSRLLAFENNSSWRHKTAFFVACLLFTYCGATQLFSDCARCIFVISVSATRQKFQARKFRKLAIYSSFVKQFNFHADAKSSFPIFSYYRVKCTGCFL